MQSHNVFRVAVALIIVITLLINRIESEKTNPKHAGSSNNNTETVPPVGEGNEPGPGSPSESSSVAENKTSSAKPPKKSPKTTDKPLESKAKPKPIPDTKPKPNKSSNKPHKSKGPKLYDPKDLSYFLETHAAHSVQDPRAFFTEERASRSLSILVHYMRTVPYKVRLAFLIRIFSEFGRKIASRLSDYIGELNAIFKESLLNKVVESGVTGVGGQQRAQAALVADAVNDVFDNKEDHEPKNIATDANSSFFRTLTRQMKEDKNKERLFNTSIDEVSTRFSHMITYIVFSTCRFKKAPAKATARQRYSKLTIPKERKDTLAWLISKALDSGARQFVMTLKDDEKFRVPAEVFRYLQLILKKTSAVLKRHLMNDDFNLGKDLKFIQAQFHMSNAKKFDDLNPMSDKNSLIGPWSNYLFSNLLNTERVVKLFCSLIRRVPNEAKTRWINIYKLQLINEFGKTLPGFVMQLANQGSWPNLNKTDSTKYLLDKFAANRTNQTKDESQFRFSDDKERLPARCYLAGRRWRALLRQALTNEYYGTESVLERFANKVAELRVSLQANDVPLAKNLIRACLPMLEKALRGLLLSGVQQLDTTSSTLDKVAALYSGTTKSDDRKLWELPLSDTIYLLSAKQSTGEPDLKDDPPARSGDDMFARAAKFGYWLGFKLGYNERRETDSLSTPPNTNEDQIPIIPKADRRRQSTESKDEPELGDGKSQTLRAPYYEDLGRIKISSKEAWKDKREQSKNHKKIMYQLVKAVENRVLTEATKKAIAAAAHEVYATTINELDVRAGYRNAAKVGNKFGALRGRSVGAEVGLQQSRIVAADWLARGDLFSSMSSLSSASVPNSKVHDTLSWHERLRLAAEATGQSIGMRAGESIGAFVGQEVAALAYERKLVDGSEDTWCGVGQGSTKLAMFYLNELEAGIKLGVELGTRMGSRVASSSALDQFAPKRLPLPEISASAGKQRRGQSKRRDPFYNRPMPASSPLATVDDWEKELMVPLTAKGINKLHANVHEDSLVVSGTLRGIYRSRRVIKSSKENHYERLALVEREHQLVVTARGYLLDSSTMYLELDGTLAGDFKSGSGAGPIFVGSVVSNNPFLNAVSNKGSE